VEQVSAIGVLLREGIDLHAGCGELLLVGERFSYALAAEAVQTSKQHHVEVPLVGVEKELLEL
jgi:hypothetical protein